MIKIRYELQWFPKNTNYSIDLLHAAVSKQGVRDVTKVPYSVYGYPSKDKLKTHAIQFTLKGGYPEAEKVLHGIKNYISDITKSDEEQKFSIRAISTVDRKKSVTKSKTKRCKCKK